MMEQTLERLTALHLSAMAGKLKELAASPRHASLPWPDALAMLVDAEYDGRLTNRIATLLKKAKLKYPRACLEELRYDPGRNLRKETMRDLSGGRFILEAHNVLVSGPTGTGKSYVACALGNLACRNGHRTAYYRLGMFLDMLMAERAMGTYAKALEKLRKVKLLILDDMGADVLKADQRKILFDVIEERYLEQSVVITSQVPVEKWHEVVGEPSAAEGICDRLFHHCHKITLKGESMRKK
jgi:DNA replication protein DnaC